MSQFVAETKDRAKELVQGGVAYVGEPQSYADLVKYCIDTVAEAPERILRVTKNISEERTGDGELVTRISVHIVVDTIFIGREGDA